MVRVAIFNDTEPDAGHYGCAIVMQNLIRLIEDHGGTVVFRWPFNKDWRTHADHMPDWREVDLILVNGEGTLHHSDTRKNAMILAELGALGRSQHIPVVLVNSTLYANGKALYERLGQFHSLSVRDEASAAEARSFGLEAAVVADMTLAYEGPLSAERDRSGVGFTDSVHHSVSARLRSLARQSGASFCPMVSTVPRWPGFRKILSIARVRKWLRAYLREKTYGSDNRFSAAEQFIEWVGSKRLIVTGRYHTVTICLLTKTPFVYLESNTPKITSLLRDVGLGDSRKLTNIPSVVDEAFVSQFQFTEQEISKIDAFLVSTRAGAHRMAEAVLQQSAVRP